MKNFFRLLPQKAALSAVRSYQKTLSPDHGVFSYKHPHGYCRFSPTCSQYAYEAIEKYGVVKGGIKAVVRVFRCNPFSRGGYDPISPKNNN